MDELLARDWPGNIRELENYCKRLKVEEGEKIFSSTPPERMGDVSLFDYERYRGEIEIWNTLIQPILQEHKIDH